jgi:amino acid transporter
LLARQAWGWGWFIVILAIVNSAIANSNAGANATTRTWYSMGRIRILPAILARTHPEYRSPHIAVGLQFLLGVVLPLWLGFQYDPLTAFGFIATINVVLVILIYILVNISCLTYYLRERRAEFNTFLHGLLPILGVLVFIPAWLTASGIKVFKFVGKLSAPLSYSGPIDLIWMIIGVGYMLYLYSKAPQRIRDTGKIFLEEETLQPATTIG